uniref:Uncharacterized protein n=1 Tax=Chenopodium quinoa TaxID=63459 RepID=A0A803LR28_CHEQI
MDALAVTPRIPLSPHHHRRISSRSFPAFISDAPINLFVFAAPSPAPLFLLLRLRGCVSLLSMNLPAASYAAKNFFQRFNCHRVEKENSNRMDMKSHPGKLNLDRAVLKMARLVKDVSLKAQKVGDWKDEFGFMLADILKQNKVNNLGMRFEHAVRTADFDRFIVEYESDRISYCWSAMINFRANEEIEKEALYRVQAQKNSEKSKEFKLFTLLWGVLQNNVIDALC